MDWTLNYVQQAEDLVLRVYEARCTLEEDTAPDHGVALSQAQVEIPGDPLPEILETNNPRMATRMVAQTRPKFISAMFESLGFCGPLRAVSDGSSMAAASPVWPECLRTILPFLHMVSLLSDCSFG
jgi:hypothetical protein